MARRGVIYLSRVRMPRELSAALSSLWLQIPPYMQPLKIRNYFSQFGKVDRVYLTPEDPKHRKKRRAAGGNARKKFIDGYLEQCVAYEDANETACRWVEFCDKKIAKQVAFNLNGNIMGGKKSNYWHDDIWNIKYLPKFKWYHLNETIGT